MKQLKPCPRCGASGEIRRNEQYPVLANYAAIQCARPSCRVSTFLRESEADAIIEWNTSPCLCMPVFRKEKVGVMKNLFKENWPISRVIFVGVPLVLLYFYALVWSMLEFYSFVEGWIKNG